MCANGSQSDLFPHCTVGEPARPTGAGSPDPAAPETRRYPRVVDRAGPMRRSPSGLPAEVERGRGVLCGAQRQSVGEQSERRPGRWEAAGRIYQDLTSSGSGTVSLTISHRRRSTRLPKPRGFTVPHRADVLRKERHDKSSPSRLIDTCLRKGRKSSTKSNADIFATHTLTHRAGRNHFTALTEAATLLAEHGSGRRSGSSCPARRAFAPTRQIRLLDLFGCGGAFSAAGKPEFSFLMFRYPVSWCRN